MAKFRKKRLVNTYKIFKKAISNFGTNRPAELAGTTAYFAMFSMVPILIIIISVFGYFAGDEAIREKLFNELNMLLGQDNTEMLRKGIENFDIKENSTGGTIVGILFFFISSTALFSAMQNAINYIWRIRVKSSFRMGLLNLLKTRFLSFGVILSLGFVLLVSLILDATIAFLKDFLASQFSPHLVFVAQVANIIISLAIIAAVFGLIYRFLPDVYVRWSAVWFGAVTTSILFAVSKILLGTIIGSSNIGVVYGTAGSIVVILVWIYFVSLILYFGVTLTYEFSRFYKHKNAPAKYAAPFEIQQINYDENRRKTI